MPATVVINPFHSRSKRGTHVAASDRVHGVRARGHTRTDPPAGSLDDRSCTLTKLAWSGRVHTHAHMYSSRLLVTSRGAFVPTPGSRRQWADTRTGQRGHYPGSCLALTLAPPDTRSGSAYVQDIRKWGQQDGSTLISLWLIVLITN